MTLALASHPEVDGWDVDVIAEDGQDTLPSLSSLSSRVQLLHEKKCSRLRVSDCSLCPALQR